MINWFKGLSTSSKWLIGSAVVLGVVMIGCVIGVFVTGGITNPF